VYRQPFLAQILLTAVLLCRWCSRLIIFATNLVLSRWLAAAQGWRRRKEALDTIEKPDLSPPLYWISATAGPGRSSAAFSRTRACPSSRWDVRPRISHARPGWPASGCTTPTSTDPTRARNTAALPAASLVVICHNDKTAALKTLIQCYAARARCCNVVAARATKSHVEELRKGRRFGSHPLETLEAGMTLASACAVDTERPSYRVTLYLQQQTYPALIRCEGSCFACKSWVICSAGPARNWSDALRCGSTPVAWRSQSPRHVELGEVLIHAMVRAAPSAPCANPPPPHHRTVAGKTSACCWVPRCAAAGGRSI